MTLDGYRTCILCGVGNHDQCDGEARIYHVGGGVDVVPCECKAVCHYCLGSGWVTLMGTGDPSGPSMSMPAMNPGDKHTGASPCLHCSGVTNA